MQLGFARRTMNLGWKIGDELAMIIAKIEVAGIL